MTKGIRVFLADDHAVLRAGLKMLIDAQPDMQVVGEAENGEEAVERVVGLKPDIALLDVNMPKLDGLEALRRLKAASSQAKVLILSMYDDEGYLRRALETGASGYILKNAADSELMAALRAAARGEVYVYPSLTHLLVNRYLGREESKSAPSVVELTEREVEVLRLLAEGHTSEQVGQRLALSAKTVDTYKARVMEKLGLRSRVDLVRYALRHGLLNTE